MKIKWIMFLLITCFIAGSIMATENGDSSKGYIYSMEGLFAKKDRVEVNKRSRYEYLSLTTKQKKIEDEESALMRESVKKLSKAQMETWLRDIHPKGKSSEVEMKAKTKEWISKKGEKGFLENAGQMMDMEGNPVPYVLFKVEVNGMNMYVTEKGLTYVFLKIEEDEKEREREREEKKKGIRREKEEEEIEIKWERIDVELKGASIKKENIEKEGASTWHYNYFYPHCPDGIYGVKEYEKIRIKDVYPGIDWVLYNSSEKGYKYDFEVKLGADYRQIELVYKSKRPIKLNKEGEIEMYSAYGNSKEEKPVSYCGNKEVSTSYKINYQKPIKINQDSGYETSVVFEIPDGQLKKDEVLVIDPQLYWATFYGGGGYDGPMSVDTDNNGNVFVTGYTYSTDFPVQNAGTFFQGTNAGDVNAFILKFDNAGNRIWATYYGGSGIDSGISIATDNSGNVFVTGLAASTDFPVQNAGTFFQGTNSGALDAFILKFDNTGNRLWATFYGGNDIDIGTSITIDNSGNVFVTGYTASTNFPLQNAGTFFQGTFGGGVYPYDAFILKFNNAGNRLWATYYGGSGDDRGYSIATDNNGNVFVTGNTSSPNFPVQNAGTFFQGTKAGGLYDAFILKFDNAGNRFWATYYGGSEEDECYSIATDNSGNVFVIGLTNSLDFPVQNAGTFFQGTYAGDVDAFILKFNNAGTRLWATYYGGSMSEYILGPTYDNLAIDTCGNVYLGFETSSDPFPHLQNSCDTQYFDNTYNGGSSDILLSLFNNSGNLLWCTYLGGDGDDFRCPLAVDANNNLFVSGEWVDSGSGVNTATYPLTNPGGGAYYDTTFNDGTHNGFMVKFCSSPCLCSPYNGCIVSNVLNVTVTSTNILCNSQCTGTATATPSGGSSPYTYSWTGGQTTQTATGLCAGTYTVTVTDANGSTQTATVTVFSIPGPTAEVSASVNNIIPGGSTQLYASGGLTYQWLPTTGLSCTDCPNPVASPKETTSYCVWVTDSNNCKDSACITINVDILCDDEIFIPNVFSPNEDNINDMACVIINPSCVKELTFAIYNRWGVKVFETNDVTSCWDGKYKGKLLNSAVFFYYLQAKLIDGTQVTKSGNISLMR
jgi:gliding motility-associated-like protein